MIRETATYRRSALFEEVWAEPLLAVAKRYGVSDVALAKVCRRLGIPLPGRGFWARKQTGAEDVRPPLPPRPDDVPEELNVERWRRPPQELQVETREHVASEKAPESTIVVAGSLQDPHALVAAATKALKREKPRDGLVRCYQSRCLDVKVSPKSLDRALRIMDPGRAAGGVVAGW